MRIYRVVIKSSLENASCEFAFTGIAKSPSDAAKRARRVAIKDVGVRKPRVVEIKELGSTDF